MMTAILGMFALGAATLVLASKQAAQSKLTNIGARVCWNNDQKDQGTVTGNIWSGVTIAWDNRITNSICLTWRQ
jgi:hypothetical protein